MIPGYIQKALEALGKEGCEAYIVGGAVRDFLRGVPAHDYDISTSALPGEVAEILNRAGFRRIIDSSVKYGTVVFLSENGECAEVTTFRKDFDYDDSRHPGKVIFAESMEDDALRRDFTMNAVYMDKDGRIYDPVNGSRDIESRIIRAVGRPEGRMREDALRILRAVRFMALTGFEIEEKTREAMISCAPLLKSISSERILAELTEIVTAPEGPPAIRENVEVISALIPELLLQKNFDQRSQYHDRDLLSHTLDTLAAIPVKDGRKDTALSFAALLHDIGKPETFTLDSDGFGHMKGHAQAGERITLRIAEELRFPARLRDELVKLVRYHDTFPSPTRKSVRRFISTYGAGFCRKLFILQRADILAHSAKGRERIALLDETERIFEELLEEESCFRIKDLAVNGDDIIALGVPPGPGVGKILDELLGKVLDEELENTRDDLTGYISNRLMNNL